CRWTRPRRAERTATPALRAPSRARATSEALLFGGHAVRHDLRPHLEIRRHVERAQRLLHEVAEHRARHVADEVRARRGLVDHHGADDARLADGRHADEPRAVFLVGVTLAFLLVGGAALAAHRIADGL